MTEQNTLLITTLQQKSNEGDAQAQYELACRYAAEDTNAVEENRRIALEWLQKSAELGLVNAQLALGYYYTVDILINDEQNKAILGKRYLNYHGINYPQSPFHLSMALLSRTNENTDLGFNWFLQAAEQNNTEAYYWLACCYGQGIGTKQNHDKAFNEFKKAADQGMFEALERIAIYYLEGKGIEKSYEHAYEYYEKAAEQGNVNAKEWLELQSRNFANINFDDEKFAQEDILIFWLTKAAEHNIAEAQYRLALCYFEGKGVKRNDTTGMEWLVEAATTNKHQAANLWFTDRSLSLIFPYLEGKTEVEDSYKFAVEWCKNEIAKGTDTAEVSFCLGIMYLQGKGVEQNYDLALKYFCTATNDEDLWDLAMLYSASKEKVTTNYRGDEYLATSDYTCASLGRVFKERKIYKDRPVLPLLSIQILSRRNEYDLLKEFLSTYEISYGDDVTINIKNACFLLVDLEETIYKQNQVLDEKNKQLQASQIELEDMMSMFAHKFRSPLDAIIYNTQHENQVALYTEAAQTMRGLLNIFSIISTDADILIDKIKQDYQGSGQLEAVFSKTLDMILLHLLSVSGAEKIQQHYLSYAKTHGQCDAQVSYKTWCEDYFELEQVLQSDWETSYAQLLNQTATLELRLAWLEEHFFKLKMVGFERADIQFKEYGITESLLTILLNEILVNTFKYYSSSSKQPVILEWVEREDYQVLVCCNPSARSERTIIKGSNKGHVFLSTLARKTGSLFNKPRPEDNFVLEFGIPNELLIS